MELKDVKKHKLYTSAEIAVFMGVDQQTVMRYVRHGQLEAIDITKKGSRKPKYRFTAQMVQDYYDRLAGKKVAMRRAASYGSGMKV